MGKFHREKVGDETANFLQSSRNALGSSFSVYTYTLRVYTFSHLCRSVHCDSTYSITFSCAQTSLESL